MSITALRSLLTLAGIALLAHAPAHAQETALQQYDVELVIFRVNTPTGTPEDWSLEEARAKAALPQTVADEPSDTPVETPAVPPVAPSSESTVQSIPGGPTRLNAIESALRRNRSYTPIAHVGWTQPGFAINNPRPLTVEAFMPPESGVTGTASLVRGRYLHLTLELSLMSPDGKRYVLREQRRMRSGDKHYFDHPYFGVIALVTPRDGR